MCQVCYLEQILFATCLWFNFTYKKIACTNATVMYPIFWMCLFTYHPINVLAKFIE